METMNIGDDDDRNCEETEKKALNEMETDMDVDGQDQDEAKGTIEDNPPPPRLMISKMVLENFKSYAGVREIGPFHKCFSSVVGPNGSGKSNVIDAMLFVFGKRAKKLRLNKVSELIHNSENYRDNPLQFARVSVYFHDIIDTGQGDADYNIVPGSECVISRIATCDNGSSYQINGRNSTFSGVAKWLGSKGIDLDNNRFLILQGEVELVSMMPPRGRTEGEDGLLEYLEEIIGSNSYVKKTDEAFTKVEGLGDVRQEHLNRVKAVEKEREALEGAKIEAEALLQKEREIRKKKNVLYQLNFRDASEDVEAAKETHEKLSAELKAERSKLGLTDLRISEIEEGIVSQTSEHENAYAELVKTKKEFTSYERRDIKLREDIKHEKSNKKKLEKKFINEEKKEKEAEQKAEEAEESVPHLESLIGKLKDTKVDADGKLEVIQEKSKEQTEGLRADLEIKTKKLAPVTERRTEYQTSLDTAEAEVCLLEDATTRVKDQLDSAEREFKALDSKQEKIRGVLSKTEDELTESKQRVDDAQREEKELSIKEGELSKNSTELTAQAEEAKASLQAGTSRSKSVTAILKASRKGGELSDVGIIGRLGDLATIPEKYDVAISTACGMLDHIVVHTTSGAQRCLDFLRRHECGRANFIPLEKMKKGAHDRVVETPEGASRLFDVISPRHHAISPALYLGVGNTLVAPDLETATRWAYEFGKRWRVVTRDGSLIELSGTMQGGGKSVRKGGMRLQNSKGGKAIPTTMMGEQSEEDIVKLESTAKLALESLQECRSQRRSLSAEIRDLQKRIKVLSLKVPKLTLEISSCDTTREELAKRIPELKSQCTLTESDSKKRDELKKLVVKCKSDMASCAMLASKLEGEVAKVQRAILEAGGTELKEQRKLCRKAQSDLDKANGEINRATVLLASSKKASLKADKAKIAVKIDLDKSIQILEKMQGKFEELEGKAMVVAESFEKVKEVEAERRKVLEGVSAECDELKATQSKMKCNEVELIAKFDSNAKVLKDYQKRIKHWKNEISVLHACESEEEEYDFSDDESEDEEENEDEEEQQEQQQQDQVGKGSNNRINSDDEIDVNVKDKEIDDTDKSMNNKVKTKSSLPSLPLVALGQYSRDEIKRDISILEEERDSIARNANMGAIAEYRKKEQDYLLRVSELDQVTEQRNEARKDHEDLRRLRLDMFMEGFGKITLKLKEMYQMITLGGDAELELVDSLDPFSEGIVFSVRPPKKSWKNISNLSGGEKTLSSLALVFALHHYNPTPLYVMDEIDAALDFKNVSIVANYIKERTKDAQFIIISLRNNMFELADRLVGIYKTENCTKSVTIDPKAFSIAAADIPKGKRSMKTLIATPKKALKDCTNNNSSL